MYPSAMGGPVYVRPPSGATAVFAAILALLWGLLSLFGVAAFLAFAAEVGGVDEAVGMLGGIGPDWWEAFVLFGHAANAITAALLLIGAVQLLRRRLSGRTMIIFGCLLVIATSIAGLIAAQAVVDSWYRTIGEDYGGEFSSTFRGISLAGAGISLGLLIFPVLTLLLAAVPATRRWCEYRASAYPPGVVSQPYLFQTPPGGMYLPQPAISTGSTDRTMINPASQPHRQPVVPPPRIPVATLLGDISLGDRVRDGVAAVLVAGAWLLPWNRTVDLLGGTGSPVVRAMLVFTTLFALLALALPYLARLGAWGRDWSSSGLRAVQFLGIAPYVVLVAGFVLADIGSARSLYDERAPSVIGTGPGAWAAVAGVILAVQPRTAHGDHGIRSWRDPARAVLWSAAGLCLLSGMLILGAMAVATGSEPGSPDAARATVLALRTMTAAGVAAVAAAGLGVDYRSWRPVVIAYGTAVLAVSTLEELFGSGGVEWFGSGGYSAGMAWCAAAALAAGPSRPPDPAARGGVALLTACRNALVLIAFQTCFDAMATVFGAALGVRPADSGVLVAVFSALILLAAVTGAQALRPWTLYGRDPRPQRLISLAMCGAIVVLSAGRAVLGPELGVEVTTGPVVLVLAVAVTVLLVVAAPVTALYGERPLLTELSAALRAAVPAPPASGRPDPDQLATTDPRTPEALLARIAQRRPDLHAAIAAHPNTRRGLLDWLAAQGDPAVARVVADRVR